MHLWGKGVHGESLYLPFNLAVSLKLTLKNNVKTNSTAFHSLRSASEIINMNYKAFGEQNSNCVSVIILLHLWPLSVQSFYQCLMCAELFFYL